MAALIAVGFTALSIRTRIAFRRLCKCSLGYHTRAMAERRQIPIPCDCARASRAFHAITNGPAPSKASLRMADRQPDAARASADKSAAIGLMRAHPTFAHLSEASIATLIDRSALSRFAG